MAISGLTREGPTAPRPDLAAAAPLPARAEPAERAASRPYSRPVLRESPLASAVPADSYTRSEFRPEAAGQHAVPPSDAARRGDAVSGEGGCSSCENRRYMDRSDDSTVSFQAPTRIPKNAAASQVAAHEREHVFHERADAERDGRKVVSQSVSIRYATCPECGSMHVAGGVTHTVTRKENAPRPARPPVGATKGGKNGG